MLGLRVRVGEGVGYDPSGAEDGEIDGEFGPIELDFVIGEQDPNVDQEGKGRQHGGEEDCGEASADAGEDGKTCEDESDAGQVSPEDLRRWQPFGNEWGGEVHVDEVRSAPYQCTDAKDQLPEEG